MENNLIDIIIKAKEKDNKAIEILLSTFDNIINKYSRKLNGDDTKQDLYIFLIDIINNMEIDSKSIYYDKQIFSYISKSLKNEFIRLSKINSKIKLMEVYIDNDFYFSNYFFYSDIEILDMLKVLNSYERDVINLIFFNGYTVLEISKKLKKSRQAINKTKNKALKKLYKFI